MGLTKLQQATSDHVFEVLINKKNNSINPAKYLIADEVGLGKTVIAADIIRRLAERKHKDYIHNLAGQSDEKPVELTNNTPFIVYYICSNERVIAQNKKKLIEECGAAETRDDRLSMQWQYIDDGSKAKIKDKKNIKYKPGIWILPVTPATTFTNKNSSFNRVEYENQKNFLKKYKHEILKGINEIFDENNYKYYEQILENNSALADYMKEASEASKNPSFVDIRNIIVRYTFRKLLKPDLILMDEFQNYSKLVYGKLDDDKCNDFFADFLSCSDYVLMLSATPYDMSPKEVKLMNAKPFNDHTELDKSDRLKANQEEEQDNEFSDNNADNPNENFRKLVEFIAGKELLGANDINDTGFLYNNVFCRSERIMFYKNSKNDEVKEIYPDVEDETNHIEYTSNLFREYKNWDFASKNFNQFINLVKECPSVAKFATRYVSIKGQKGDLDFFRDYFDKGIFDENIDVNLHNNLRMVKKVSMPDDGISKMLWIPPTILHIPDCYENDDNPFWTYKNYTKTLIFGNYRLSTACSAFYLSKWNRENQENIAADVVIDRDYDIDFSKPEDLDDSGWLPHDLINPANNMTEYKNALLSFRNMIKVYLLSNKRLICAVTGESKVQDAINKYADMGDLKHVIDEYAYLLGLYIPDRIEGSELIRLINKLANLQKQFDNMKEYFSVDYKNRKFKPTRIIYYEKKQNDVCPEKPEDKERDEEEFKSGYSFECGFAERFTDDDTDCNAHNRSHQELLQELFNSPFYPFVMSTTSIAQEGLDFHYYCHRVVHWSVPKTPIAFEQREGRIDRYMSHLVRKRLVMRYSNKNILKMLGKLKAPDEWKTLGNINALDNWKSLMALAEEEKETRERKKGLWPKPLFPYWYVEKQSDNWPNFIRVICAMPNSRESKYFAKLKNALQKYNYYLGPNYQENKKTSRNLCPLKIIARKRVTRWKINYNKLK